MVNNCANPRCAKPLHYLREGRIFVFDVLDNSGPGEKRTRHLEHYWLCGECSQHYLVVRKDGAGSGVDLVPRHSSRMKVESLADTALAS